MQFLDITWLAVLGGAALWTILFSMSNHPPIRGWRNLGMLACYVLGIVMLFFAPWRASLGNWALFGFGSGLVYFLYETYSYVRSKEPGTEKPRLSTILNGLLMWPVMLPEAIEYWLADLGVLNVSTSSDHTKS